MLGQRRGFTIIELLIVVLVVSILAAIAIPRYHKSREKTFFASMQSDLKNLMAAEEIYYSTHGYQYAGAAGDAVPGVTGLQFATSKGVEVTLQEVAQTGWSALATHASLHTTQFCAVLYGDAAPVDPAQTAGVVSCTGEE